MIVRLEPGDCLEVIPRLVAEGVQVDAIVCDPPYGLEFMGKEWDGADGFRRSLNAADVDRDNVFGRTSRTSPEYRTGWQSGGGFSKPGIGERKTPWPSFSATSPFGAANPTCSACGGRARGKKKCTCAEPIWKPIGTRRNPENEGLPDDVTGTGARGHLNIYQEWSEAWGREAIKILRPGGFLVAFGGTRTYHRMVCGLEDAGFVIQDMIEWLYATGFPKHRSHLKPSHEPIVLAYKPGGARTMQIDECRVGDFVNETPPGTDRYNQKNYELGYRPNAYQGNGREGEASAERRYTERGSSDFAATPGSRGGSPAGRWPANVCLEDSGEVSGFFPQSAGQSGAVTGEEPSSSTRNTFALYNHRATAKPRGDTGSAARFFFSAKAGADDRFGSKHPTVKPIDLIAWLVALVTPPGGTFLDCFAGSGTAGVAALKAGRNAILIEREGAYVADIRERMAFYEGGGRHSTAAKARAATPRGTLPLFEDQP